MTIDIRVDDQGLIVQTDFDGGDCAARTGELYTGLCLNGATDEQTFREFTNSVDLLEPNKDGILLRYNRPPYNDPLNGDFSTSRDQTVPMIIAAGFYGKYGFLKRLAIAQLKRFTLFQNKDICSPENIGQYIRAFAVYRKIYFTPFYPILLLGDLFMLLSVIVRCVQGRKWDDVGDDILCIQSMLQATFVLPTPLSWLTRKIYAKFRPYGPYHAMEWYHRPESFGNPIDKIYRPLIEKWLS